MFNYLFLKNFGTFSSLEWKTHNQINVIIGENDTGKTHLLKLLYCVAKSIEEFSKRQDKPAWGDIVAEKLFWVYEPETDKLGELVKKGETQLKVKTRLEEDKNYYFNFDKDTTRKILDCSNPPEHSTVNALFIPPREVLTDFNVINPIYESLKNPDFKVNYEHNFLDLIKALRLPSKKGNIQKNLQDVLHSLENLLKGEIVKDDNQFIFKRGQEKYWMSQTAEGFKKIGIFNTLIQNRTLNPETILFMDEPETNLHPKAIIILVEMLFNLSQAGIQMYLSTHSYSVIKKLEILAQKHQTPIQICSLKRNDKEVIAQFSDLKDGMPDNPIVDAAIKLYEEEVQLEIES